EAHVATLDRHREHGQALVAVEPAAAPQIVAAPMPAAAKLGSLQAAELQGKRAVTALVGHGQKLSIDVGEKNGVSIDVDRFHSAGGNVRDGTETTIHRLLRAAQSAQLEQRTVPRRRALADDQLLQYDETGTKRF